MVFGFTDEATVSCRSESASAFSIDQILVLIHHYAAGLLSHYRHGLRLGTEPTVVTFLAAMSQSIKTKKPKPTSASLSHVCRLRRSYFALSPAFTRCCNGGTSTRHSDRRKRNQSNGHVQTKKPSGKRMAAPMSQSNASPTKRVALSTVTWTKLVHDQPMPQMGNFMNDSDIEQA